MTARRQRRSPRFSVDAVEVVSGRVSKAARQMLVRQARDLKVPLSIHVRRILYRHLNLVEGES